MAYAGPTYEIRFVQARLSDLDGLVRTVERAGKRDLALVDANLILHGLFPWADTRAKHGFREKQLDFAGRVMQNLSVGRNDSAYAPAFFGPNHLEIKTQIRNFSYQYRSEFYKWLSATTSMQQIIFLEADVFVSLPEDIRNCFLRYCKGNAGSNMFDKALLSAAILIAKNTGLEVLVASHDQDITNSMLGPMLKEYGVLVNDAEGLHKLLTKGLPPPKKVAVPAAVRTMPGYAPASQQSQP